ncbi:MAG: hypothetical protein WBH44_00140 [Proteocatella sp.]
MIDMKKIKNIIFDLGYELEEISEQKDPNRVRLGEKSFKELFCALDLNEYGISGKNLNDKTNVKYNSKIKITIRSIGHMNIPDLELRKDVYKLALREDLSEMSQCESLRLLPVAS